MELNEIELGVKIYKEVLTSLKKHCKEHQCSECVFKSDISHCLLLREPALYDIELLSQCIRADIEEEIKNGTE